MTKTQYVEIKECPFCGCTTLHKFKQRTDGLWVLLCDYCELGFVEKYPLDLADFYNLSYYEKSPVDTSTIGYDNYGEIKHDYLLWAIALVALTKTKGSLLDLGCANGLFLDLAKAYGFNNLEGIELNPEYAQLCRDKGYNTYNQDFLKIDFDQNQQYNAITAWAMLEHVAEIKPTLQKIKGLLEPGGLFFFEVPCLIFDESDAVWLSSSLEHIYYFTEKSLRTIFETVFGQSYCGRVVKQAGFGSSVVGFISNDTTGLPQLHEIAKYLFWLSKADLPKIDNPDLYNYLIFYIRYLADFETAQFIIEYLSLISIPAQITLPLASFYINFLADRYITDHNHNQILLEAKKYFLGQIELKDRELARLNSVLGEGKKALDDLKKALDDSKGAILLKSKELEQTTRGKNRELAQKAKEIELKIKDIQNKEAALLDKDYQIWVRDIHIQNLTSSKLYRLKEAILNDKLSFKKLLRITYLIAALTTPSPLKRLLRPAVHLLRQAIIAKHQAQATDEATISTLRIVSMEQEEWPADKPLVSIIIPCYNYGEYIEEAVDSVLSQTFKNVEIIIVNDGSDDPYTQEVLSKLEKPRTKIIEQANQGVTAARNYGMAAAQGKYACFLDADDLLHPTYLEKCLVKLETENLDICYSWLKEVGATNGIYRTSEFTIENLMQENVVIISAVFKTSLWKQVGGLKATGYEDWEFWLSLAETGAIGGKIDEPLFLYRKHGYSRIDFLTEHHEQNYQELKRLHRKLFSKPVLVQQIKLEQQTKYRVRKGFRNLANPLLSTNCSDNKVLVALPWTIIGGADNLLTQVVAVLEESGSKVTIVTTLGLSPEQATAMGDSRPEYEKYTKDIHQLPAFLQEEDWKKYIYYLIETRSIGLIYLAGSSYLYSILEDIKRRFPHIKIVDQIFNEFGHMEDNRKNAKYIDLTITDNELVETSLLKKHGEKKEKVRLIHTGINLEYFTPQGRNTGGSYRANANLHLKNKFVVSFFGRFSEEKWPELVLEIANEFKYDDKVIFLMCGNGPLFEKTKGLVEEYQLYDKVLLPGFVTDRELFQYLSISNIVILTSRIEGRPFIVLESLAMGVPVVAPKVGGLSWLIESGQTGFLCEPGNVTEFKEAIELIKTDKDLRTNLSHNARQYAIQHLDAKVMKANYVEVCKSLMGSEKKGATSSKERIQVELVK